MSYKAPAESTTHASELGAALARVGLSQYEERLKENGFETWGRVTAITEADMAEMEFKLGDRRKLQRAIRENSRSMASQEDRATNLSLSSTGLSAVGAHSEDTSSSSQQSARPTRRYRRHPRPDPHAPDRPKSAYIVFGEHVRQNPALRALSFAELAKETGKRWGELPHEERVSIWERPAVDRLQRYKEELDRYRLTENYRSYQRYLERFKQGRRSPKPITPSDEKAPSILESTLFSWLPESLDQEEVEAALQESVNAEDPNPEGHSQDTISSIKAGIEEVRNVLKDLGINFHSIRTSALPLEDITTAAVKAFLNGTGSLLYLWNHDEALDLVRSVYHSEKDSTPLDATEVFAMAAVGSYCDGDASLLAQEHFLDFFLCLLSSPSHMCNLRRMRLFACLAICRFMNNVESARRLMLHALDIGRQTFISPSFGDEIGEGMPRYWWNVFRSIVFLESWFAYNTGRESRITEQDLTSYLPRSYATDQLEPFHEKVSELGQLAAYIALDLKAASRPRKVMQAQGRFESLNEWQRNLPPLMQLSRLNFADPLIIDLHTKRSLLQLHILFLGLFIEPYRSCLIDIGQSRLHETPIEPGLLQTMKAVEEQCILAARQSAQVASLLQINNLIRAHCWVIVLTSFTGCSVLLFSASQKLMLLAHEETSQELVYSCSHLNVLSLCSYNSDAARKLYTTLQIIFNDIREIVVSPAYQAMRELHLVVKDATAVPLGYYDAVEGASEISKNILDLVGRTMAILQDNINY